MALTEMERSLCNSLRQKFEPIISPIENVEASFRKRKAEFEAALRSTSFSPQGDINQAISDLQSQANTVIPGDSLSDMDKLRDFINSCEFLSGVSPVAAVLGGITGMFNKIDSFIDNIGISVPEIGLAKLADQMNRILSGLGIPGGSNISNLFGQGDKLIQCINNLCGESEYQVWVIAASDTIENLYTNFNVVSDPLDSNYGKFNFSSSYTDAGLTPGQTENMNLAVAGVTSVKDNSIVSINNTVSSIKSLIRIGGFF